MFLKSAWTLTLQAGLRTEFSSVCERIGNTPRGGVSREDLGSGIRIVPFDRRAVILYRESRETIEIVNVFCRGRDYEAILGNKQ